MKKSLRSLCAVTTISLCAMGNLFAVDNNYFNSVYMIDQKQSLVQEWDKVFPQSDKVHHMKVTFRNRYGIILAADMYIPRNAEGKLPAIAVSGPFGAVKEQSSGLYAQALAERGFLTIAFDPSYTGERRDGVLLLSGIGKRYSFGYGFSMKSEIVDWDERLIDTLCREVCSLHSCEISHRA